MKVALIAPRAMLEWTELGDMHFIIPDNASTVFFANSTKYKMLDNGTFERGKPISSELLLDWAKCLKVDEIVLPDVMFQADETLGLTKRFIETTFKRYKYAAVPQGKDPMEWRRSYDAMAQIPEIDVLCIPIWLQKKFGCRSAVIHKLIKDKMLARKEHHLIGLDGYGELFNYPYGVIRSVDTSLPFSRTAANLEVTFEDSKVSRILFAQPLITYGSSSIDLLRQNIYKLMEVAHRYA